MTCNTDGVVYVLWCPCDLLYVGETKCDFTTRGRVGFPVSKHFLYFKHNERDLRFMLVDYVLQPLRGGEKLTALKKGETCMDFQIKYSETK